MGCSKGGFYHHFETKMDLLMEIARQHVRQGMRLFLAETLRNPLDALDRLLYRLPLQERGGGLCQKPGAADAQPRALPWSRPFGRRRTRFTTTIF